MFEFLRRSRPRRLSGPLARAIAKDGLPASVGRATMLRVVKVAGQVSDRKVTLYRIFDQAAAAKRALDVRSYRDLDLDAFRGLILRSGHVERGGSIFVTRPARERTAETTARLPADRTGRDDDARTVSRGGAGSGPEAAR